MTTRALGPVSSTFFFCRRVSRPENRADDTAVGFGFRILELAPRWALLKRQKHTARDVPV